MLESRRSVVMGLGAVLAASGCGQSDGEEGTIVGRIPDPTLPWNAPETEAAQRDLPLPMRDPDRGSYDMALSADGALLAAALPFAPSNEVLIVDIAARRGWRVQHPHRRVLITQPAFLADGRLSLVVTPPPMYFGVSEIWVADAETGAAWACVSGRPAYLYRKPHFSDDGAKCLSFREANTAPNPPLPTAPRREYREPSAVSLFEIDVVSGAERRLSERVFDNGQAFYAGDRNGYYLSTSPPLIAGEPAFDGAPTPYNLPSYRSIDAERYPFAGFFVAANEEIPDRPASVIPNALYDLDEVRGAHVRLEDADRTGQLVVSYQHPHPNAAFGLCESAAIVAGGEIRRRVELDGPRFSCPRISGDGRTVIGLRGAHRDGGADLSFPDRDRPFQFIVDRMGARDRFQIGDLVLQARAVGLQPHANAEIV